MIETVISLDFPVEESFRIKKHRIFPAGYADTENQEGDSLKRISIVTGTHGDELEGQYVCYLLSKRIMDEAEHLHGIVDIYPALNPLGIDSIERGIPGFDLDMNRIFPGNVNGSMAEQAAAGIVRDLSGSDMVIDVHSSNLYLTEIPQVSDMVIDIHSSNLYLTEIPQVRISETFEDRLTDFACQLNTDFIWIHSAATVLEATLAHSLNVTGTPTLVVEMGIGLRLTQAYAEQLVSGIFSLMHYMGIWDGEFSKPRRPLISRRPEDVEYLNAAVSGIFVQYMEHNSYAREGQVIGVIADPLLGEVLCEVTAPCDGLIFTLRDFPMVDEGSLVGRMIRAEAIDPVLRAEYESRGTRMVSSLDLARYRGGAE